MCALDLSQIWYKIGINNSIVSCTYMNANGVPLRIHGKGLRNSIIDNKFKLCGYATIWAKVKVTLLQYTVKPQVTVVKYHMSTV